MGVRSSALLAQRFGASAAYLCQKKESVMFEIIISIGLYFGAIVLLVKGAIIYCEHCPE